MDNSIHLWTNADSGSKSWLLGGRRNNQLPRQTPVEVSGATYIVQDVWLQLIIWLPLLYINFFFHLFIWALSLFPSAHFSYSLESCFVHIHDHNFNSFGENMVNYQFVRKNKWTGLFARTHAFIPGLKSYPPGPSCSKAD